MGTRALVAGCVAIAAVWGVAAEAAGPGLVVAYIDPGAGSFLLQAVVAALAGVIVTVNVYWRKIRQFLGLGPGSSDPDDSASRDPADE